MKLNKKTLFQVHSWIGIKLSILFFIVCFSGTMATLSNEMDWLFYPGLRASGTGERVSYNQLVQAIQEKYPDRSIAYWVTSEAPYLNDIVYMEKDGNRKYVFVDPILGEVTGSTNVTFQRFFRDFHYYLFMPFYQIGYFLVLVFAFFLMISLVTALIFYKKWWKKLFDLKKHKGSLVLFRSMHRVVGLWSLPFALLFSVTGIWYFVERTNIGNVSDLANPTAPKLEGREIESSDSDEFTYHLDYDQAMKLAQEEIPGLNIGDIVPAASPSQAIYITGKSQVPLVRNRANRIYIDPISNEVLQVQRAETIPTVMYLNDIADPLHFGNWGGLLTKVLWFFAGLSICGLILTGIWIALKRQFQKNVKEEIAPMGYWKYLNWGFTVVIAGFMFYFMLERYQLPMQSVILVSLILIFLLSLCWYVFEYRLVKSIKSPPKKIKVYQ